MANYISEYAQISNNVQIDSPIRIYGSAKIQTDSIIEIFTIIEDNTTIFPKTYIGKYSYIGKGCEIGAIAHPVKWLSTSPIQYNISYHFKNYKNKISQKTFKRPMETDIGNDVSIGSLSVVLRGVKIADGAMIRARSVVTKDIPAYAIVEGIPAKIVGYRFNNIIIKKLLKLKWWDINYKRLSKVTFKNIELAIEELTILKEKIDD